LKLQFKKLSHAKIAEDGEILITYLNLAWKNT